LAKSISSVQSVKLVNQIAPGTAEPYQAVAVIELSGTAKLSDVVKALETAETPHKGAHAPGVVALVPGKVKAGTTPAQIHEAIKKAGLTE
jgi:hypothetical protein